MQLNRRNWLKNSLMMSAGAVAAPSLVPMNAYCEPWLDAPETMPVMPPKGGVLKARLSANENPYGPSPKAVKAISEAAADGYLYPFSYGAQLRKMIAEQEGVAEEQILLAPGSGSLLVAAALYYSQVKPGGTIISADPTYEQLMRAAVQHGAKWEKVPLTTGDYDHNLAEMEKRVGDNTSLMYVNNPTTPPALRLIQWRYGPLWIVFRPKSPFSWMKPTFTTPATRRSLR